MDDRRGKSDKLISELEKMIRGFRVTDLQNLLLFAGRNKNGKKHDLQDRALNLLKVPSPQIFEKVKELHYLRVNQSRSTLPEGNNMYEMDPLAPTYPSRMPHPMSSSAYGSYIPPKHMIPHLPPATPDVRFIELPFYDVLDEILRPHTLNMLPSDTLHGKTLPVFLAPQTVSRLVSNYDYTIQIQMRVCVLDTSSEQDDEIPAQLDLAVNNRSVVLPPVIPTNKPPAEQRRPKRPVDLTGYFRKSATEPNNLQFTWKSPPTRVFAAALFLVRKNSHSTLIRRLKENGVRNPDHTTAMIKEKLCQDRDSEIATMSLRGSLMCPLGKVRMKLPCRAITCSHLQCFDASLYVQMNEKKPKWICPVCDKPAPFKSLAIDGLFLDIVARAPDLCTEVQFHEDGSWTVVMPQKKTETIDAAPSVEVAKVSSTPSKAPKKTTVEVISLDSDSDTEDSWPLASMPPAKKLCTDTIDIDSPEVSQQSDDASSSFQPYSPPDPSFIPKQANLPPLPESLDIEPNEEYILGSEGVIVGMPPAPSNPKPGSYSNPVEVSSDTGPSKSYNNNFDFFSLIKDGSEPTYNYPQEDSPDIINLD